MDPSPAIEIGRAYLNRKAGRMVQVLGPHDCHPDYYKVRWLDQVNTPDVHRDNLRGPLDFHIDLPGGSESESSETPPAPPDDPVPLPMIEVGRVYRHKPSGRMVEVMGRFGTNNGEMYRVKIIDDPDRVWMVRRETLEGPMPADPTPVPLPMIDPETVCRHRPTGTMVEVLARFGGGKPDENYLVQRADRRGRADRTWPPFIVPRAELSGPMPVESVEPSPDPAIDALIAAACGPVREAARQWAAADPPAIPSPAPGPLAELARGLPPGGYLTVTYIVPGGDDGIDSAP